VGRVRADGPLGAAEAARLSVAAVVLVPLRLVAGVLVLLAYYLVCRVCTLRVEEEREVGGEGDGYARLEGWRRGVVVRCSRALARAMMFVFGFYWIREYDCRCLHAEVVNAEWFYFFCGLISRCSIPLMKLLIMGLLSFGTCAHPLVFNR
jgi:hypothetical protein